MSSETERCVWISPSAVSPDGPPSSAQRYAASVRARGEIAVIGLRIWSLPPTDPYDLEAEVAAVRAAAAGRGWTRFHLFGFSAGATMALATARESPEFVASLALFEPATIGDDDWDPAETRWRHDLDLVRHLSPQQQQPAFRRLVMAPQAELPASLAPAPGWDSRTDRLEDLLADVGFRSADLAAITQPTLVMSGSESHPRFHRLAERLVDVLPHARSVVFAGCSHLSPPHRVAPDQLTDELTRLWRLSRRSRPAPRSRC